MEATTTGRRELMPVAQVAQELDRTMNSVYWLINSGQLKAGKIGGRLYVRRSDLDALVDAAFAEAG